MKISFWSPIRRTAGVTTNLACVSAFLSMQGQTKTVLLENHYNANGLGEMLLFPERRELLRERGEYFSHYGIEYVLKRLYSGEPGEKLIHSAVIPLLLSRMLYLPQAKIVNKEVFNYEFHAVYERLFESLLRISDYVFIDTETNQNLSSHVIISAAELVVVNLDQNPIHLKQFFEDYRSLQEKCVYLIGNYEADSPWNITRICREFHVPSDKIGVIPYNLELADAVKTGHVLPFLNRNAKRGQNEENEYFMRYVRRAGKMLRKNALQLQREKARLSGGNRMVGAC